MQKCQIPDFLDSPSLTRIWAPLLISGCNPKLKNWALDCCWAYRKVSKMVCHNLIAQKLTKKIGSLEMDFCQTRDLVVTPWGQVTNSTIRHLLCTDCENLAKIQSSSQKLFNLCPHTDTHFPSLRRGRDFLHVEMFTFSLHYVHLFTSLTYSLHLWRIIFSALSFQKILSFKTVVNLLADTRSNFKTRMFILSQNRAWTVAAIVQQVVIVGHDRIGLKSASELVKYGGISFLNWKVSNDNFLCESVWHRMINNELTRFSLQRTN